MKLSAIIFDLDGTVLADEDEYGKAFANVLAKLGVKTTSSYPHTAGIGVGSNWEQFIKKYQIKTKKSVSELGQETQDEYIKLLKKVTLKKGFKKFVGNLKESNILTALATSNSWGTVEKIFEALDIEKYFDCVTTVEEVAFTKPNPQIFFLAAEKLGVDPNECLVIEDSKAGVDAAQAAGMKVVALARNKSQRKVLKNANLVVKDFSELSFEILKGL